MTHLRKLMLEELQRRNYSEATIRGYLRAVSAFAKHFGKSPDKLGPEELRQYQVYLLREKRLTPRGVEACVGAAIFVCEDAQAARDARASAVSQSAA